MVQFIIEVINVSAPNSVKTKSGGYKQIEVAYKRDGRVDGKKLVDFNGKDTPNNVAIYNLCSKLKGGELLSVTAEKGEKFWNWVNVEPYVGTVGSGEQTQTDAGDNAGSPVLPVAGTADSRGTAQAGGSRGRVTGSTYETPAERALRREADRVRQFYIVRQSSVSAAIDMFKAQGDQNFNTSNVIDRAREFEAYVFEAVPAAAPVAETESDIPF